ncbi:hypothetical protein N008_00150 [Hymenobacter sp. APR13]|nr:hypothetical protein N008_00150 [Hymenobacter sp. APR13]
MKHLWQHDTNKPVGKPESIIEDQNGLLVNSKISKTQLGKDLMILVEDGVMNENSIGFYTIKASKDEAKGIRNIHEVQLFEYSSVTWGSNDQAQNIGLKSLTVAEQSNELEKKMSLLEKHLRQGNLSDEMCELLVIQVAQIKSSIAEMLEQSLTVITEPEVSTLQSEQPVEVKSDRDEIADFYSAYIGYNKNNY